jgi:hypothetical protein
MMRVRVTVINDLDVETIPAITLREAIAIAELDLMIAGRSETASEQLVILPKGEARQEQRRPGPDVHRCFGEHTREIKPHRAWIDAVSGEALALVLDVVVPA